MDNINKERINEKNNSKIKYKKMNNFWEIKKTRAIMFCLSKVRDQYQVKSKN